MRIMWLNFPLANTPPLADISSTFLQSMSGGEGGLHTVISAREEVYFGKRATEFWIYCMYITLNMSVRGEGLVAICIIKASCLVLLVSKTTACCVTLAVKVASECTFSCKLV